MIITPIFLVLGSPNIFLFSFLFYSLLEASTTLSTQSTSTIKTSHENRIETIDCGIFTEGVLQENHSEISSNQSCWWLDSGAIFYSDKGVGRTIHGNLDINSYWRTIYSKSNPGDTNNGFRPQNIFRLVNRKKWENSTQSVFFKINKYDLSQSQNRNPSNGVLLMSRYIDGDNLYYAGIRVDGSAIIKKKFNGVYVTLATSEFNNLSKYDKIWNPIMIPLNQWVGQKLITQNNWDGSVKLKLFIKLNDSENWKLILEIDDNFNLSKSPPFDQKGNVGIRSDFMDIEFKDLNITNQ